MDAKFVKLDLKDVDIHGRIILKWILKVIVWEGCDWIHLAQDKDQ
jgi:hypothetical protein